MVIHPEPTTSDDGQGKIAKYKVCAILCYEQQFIVKQVIINLIDNSGSAIVVVAPLGHETSLLAAKRSAAVIQAAELIFYSSYFPVCWYSAEPLHTGGLVSRVRPASSEIDLAGDGLVDDCLLLLLK